MLFTRPNQIYLKMSKLSYSGYAAFESSLLYHRTHLHLRIKDKSCHVENVVVSSLSAFPFLFFFFSFFLYSQQHLCLPSALRAFCMMCLLYSNYKKFEFMVSPLPGKMHQVSKLIACLRTNSNCSQVLL